jgi:hypothetical protein
MNEVMKPTGLKTYDGSVNTVSVVYLGLLIIAIGGLGWAFIPGHTNYDTINMLEQARAGVFNDGHSTAVEILWFFVGWAALGYRRNVHSDFGMCRFLHLQTFRVGWVFTP